MEKIIVNILIKLQAVCRGLYTNNLKNWVLTASDSHSWIVGEMERPFGRGLNLQIEVEDVDSLYQCFKNGGYPLFLEMEEKRYRVHEKVSLRLCGFAPLRLTV